MLRPSSTRSTGKPLGGLAILIGLIVFHFAIPLAGFVSRRIKTSRYLLAGLAGIVFIGHLLDVVWRIAPAFPASGLAGFGVGLAEFLTIGALWLALAAWLLAGRPLPRHWRRAHA